MKFIYLTNNSQETKTHDGYVKVSPKVKYQIDKEHPLDKLKKIRDGKYFVYSFEVEIVLTAVEYLELINFLFTNNLFDKDTGEGLYLAINDDSDYFPICDFTELPENEDLEGEEALKIKIKLDSKFIEIPDLPSFAEYGAGNYGSNIYGY